MILARVRRLAREVWQYNCEDKYATGQDEWTPALSEGVYGVLKMLDGKIKR